MREVKVMNYASQIIGYPVISQAEANRLVVPTSEVLRVGKNAVLISNEEAARPVNDLTPPPGRSVKDMHGVWVTTMDGHHLGTVEDMSFSTDWMIAELTLAKHRVLGIDPERSTIADEILVPSDCADKIREESPPEAGHGLTRDALRKTKHVLQRAWRWRNNGPIDDDLDDPRDAPH
jgi:sporulation protein YlmC with PRC-barrel domain